MVEQTKEDIAEAMREDPEMWAELHLEQKQLIKVLTQIAEDYKSRLDLLLMDPDENEFH